MPLNGVVSYGDASSEGRKKRNVDEQSAMRECMLMWREGGYHRNTIEECRSAMGRGGLTHSRRSELVSCTSAIPMQVGTITIDRKHVGSISYVNTST